LLFFRDELPLLLEDVDFNTRIRMWWLHCTTTIAFAHT